MYGELCYDDGFIGGGDLCELGIVLDFVYGYVGGEEIV